MKIVRFQTVPIWLHHTVLADYRANHYPIIDWSTIVSALFLWRPPPQCAKNPPSGCVQCCGSRQFCKLDTVCKIPEPDPAWIWSGFFFCNFILSKVDTSFYSKIISYKNRILPYYVNFFLSSLRLFRYAFLMILVDVLLCKDPGGWKVPDPLDLYPFPSTIFGRVYVVNSRE